MDAAGLGGDAFELSLLDSAELERTLDVWASMFEERERARVQAVLATLLLQPGPDGSSTHRRRRAALAACFALGTPRLLEAASEAITAGVLPREEIAELRRQTSRITHAIRQAERLRGSRHLTEVLAVHAAGGHAPSAAVLDRVDIRELYLVAQACDDPLVRADLERRLARRGPHQRRRLAQALGVPLESLPVAADTEAAGGASPADDESDYELEYVIEMVAELDELSGCIA